jgi:Flp pilus assembly protein TadG
VTRDEGGAATVELALGIPLLVSVTIGLVWLLAVGLAQVQMVDAAREAARAGARGDAPTAAIARGRAVAPQAAVTMSSDGAQVVATASADVAPPGGLLGFLPSVRVHARAIALSEAAP